MTRLTDVTKYVRSKNAGPFWITIDIFFKDLEHYERYKDAPAISAREIASYYGVDPAAVRFYQIANLGVLKISLPRTVPQGGPMERDMHSGQQYVRLLNLPMDQGRAEQRLPVGP